MTYLKALINKPEINLEEGKIYELDEEQPIIENVYKIKIPMKQKRKFRYALLKEDEGELVD